MQSPYPGPVGDLEPTGTVELRHRGAGPARPRRSPSRQTSSRSSTPRRRDPEGRPPGGAGRGGRRRKLGKNPGQRGEGAGVFAALVILLFMFGSVLAASLPLITAVFAVGTTLGLHRARLARVHDRRTSPPPVMVLVGLGVGIDYALLIFSRYRSELLERRRPRRGRPRRALDTAGPDGLFAGCTVIIALLGLVALGLGSLQGVALAVALTVLMTMVAVADPAARSAAHLRQADRPAVPSRRHAARATPSRGHRWRAWAGVQRRPWPRSLVRLVALWRSRRARARPAARASPTPATTPRRTPAGRRTTCSRRDSAPDSTARSWSSPRATRRPPQAAAAHARDAPRGGRGHAADARPRTARSRRCSPFPKPRRRTPRRRPACTGCATTCCPGWRATPAEYLVGGATAAVIDFADAVGGKLPLFVAVVVGLSSLLLMMVFRSVLIPLKAALLNLLSVGAALGAITLVFQHGWLGVDHRARSRRSSR